MKRATSLEITAGDAFRNAFPSFADAKRIPSYPFTLSRKEAKAAVDELVPYFEAIDRLYSRDEGSAPPETKDEVWSYFDPYAVSAHLNHRESSDENVNDEAVNDTLLIIKSYCLYAHRIIFEDHLLMYLREYAVERLLFVRSDAMLLREIEFHVKLYAALLPFLDQEIVLPRAAGYWREEYSEHYKERKSPEEDQYRAIFGSPERQDSFVREIIQYIETKYSRDGLVLDSKTFHGGLVYDSRNRSIHLFNQIDLRILVNMMLEYCVSSSIQFPRLTVAWKEPRIARLHRYILEFIGVGATQREIDRPFVLTELSTNGAINAAKITSADALKMRNEEKIFYDWRALVEDSISELRDIYDTGRVREAALQRVISEREQHWKSQFSGVVTKSDYLSRIINPKTSVVTNLCVGAAFGVIVKGDPLKTAVIAGGGGVIKDSLILLADILFGGGDRKTKAMLTSHFMAIGSSIDLSSK